MPEGERRIRANLTWARQSEAWRPKQLTSTQHTAETEMETTWRVLTSGYGPVSSCYSDMPAACVAQAVQGAEVRFEQEWTEWFRPALPRKISIAVCLNVLTEPRTLAEIEKSRKLDRGAPFSIYSEPSLWCDLRGWTRRTYQDSPTAA